MAKDLATRISELASAVGGKLGLLAPRLVPSGGTVGQVLSKTDAADYAAAWADPAEGASAYEVAVANGFVGTQVEWVASLKGDKGDIGDKGDKGDTGAQGVAGPSGGEGPQGVAGPVGPQGPQGVGLVPNGYGTLTAAKVAAVEAAGVNWIYVVDPAGDLRANKSVPTGLSGDQALMVIGYQASDSSWRSYGQFTGTQGEKGDKGDTGVQGPVGATGAQGIKGDKGDKGDTGATGAQGVPAPLLDYTYMNVSLWGTGSFSSSEEVARLVTAIPFTMRAGLGGSQCVLETAPSAAMDFAIVLDDTQVGSVHFAAGARLGTITFATDRSAFIGSELKILAPASVDATAADFAAAIRVETQTSTSAYALAKFHGFVGTEAEWLASLKGTKGDTGATGAQGLKGDKGDTGATGAPGATGATGVGMKTGGTAGQVLVKNSTTDYDYAWQDLTHFQVATITGSQALDASMVGKYLRSTSATAVTLTVPDDSVVIPVGSAIQVRQAGVGAVSFVAASGVALTSPGTLALRAQNASVTLIKVAANTWDIVGDVGV